MKFWNSPKKEMLYQKNQPVMYLRETLYGNSLIFLKVHRCVVNVIKRYSVTLDPADIELRHALANMIAVVFGIPGKSTHLWYHMFAPEALENSYMTGFMVCFSILLQSVILL